MQMEELYKKMVDKAKSDVNFKERLLNNAKEVIKEELGVDFGPEVEVSVYQSTPEHRHFVIPLED